jgi:HSP20 family protein
MDRLFDDFFSNFGLTPFNEGWREFSEGWREFSPSVDISENDKEIKVSAELPGLDDDDIQVTLDRDLLTISGEKKEEKEDKRQNYYRLERSYGSFRRSLRLPAEVEADKIEATFKNGVLKITLPKTAASHRKRITVKAGK